MNLTQYEAVRVLWVKPSLDVSFSILVLLAISTLFSLRILSWALAERKIRKLGGHAPSAHSSADVFGFGYLVRMVKFASQDRNLEFFHDCLVSTGRTKSTNPFTYEFGILGERRIVTASHENIKAIHATQFNDFEKGDRFRRDWGGLLGRSIFSLDGDDWHRTRQFLRPHFSRQRVSDLECFERHLGHLFDILDGGKTVDVADVMARFAFDAAADFSLGIDVGSLTNPSHTFIEAFDRVHSTQTLIEYLNPMGWYLVPRWQYNRDLATMDAFVQPVLDAALALSDERKAEMSLGGEPEKEGKFSFLKACAEISRDKKFLRDELVTIMLAARDTTAMTLAWCLFELARSPAVVEDLRAEILSRIGQENLPTYEDLKDLRLLSWILNETLRLYPSIPYNARVAARDTSLPVGGGPSGKEPIGVPKGTLIYTCPHVLHLRGDLYPEESEYPLDQFHPRRWQKWRPAPWTYIPFGGGPRTCIGQQFVLVQMSYVLVRLFQRYTGLDSMHEKTPAGAQADNKRSSPSCTAATTSLVEDYMTSRPRMKSEITLGPRGSINLRFESQD
ncbi:cytochrome P450 52A11 [Colletotrichum higginsianum]|uniref:Cytochrome P450 52A11 n=2 Tax=Colletotrichum higginsianum TaxID=80884 RepID=H1UXN3_COLHI|nr:Cytochrome P450 52A11 [Colletotrichum higginsianum IMI 349063]OBR03092.1 Cytochrome P450 52A11 [Colletotrichum higginsianum IMI 349063]TIC91156.1 Cytochrome P450 52A13 [Colletotrichum higginsianum]CCF32734.1 cytochrome P450 52A11 [Colletotrichum higginsianum]